MSADQDKELMKMWQQSVMASPMDAGELAKTIAARMQGFDRRIYWRNVREYAAGGGLIAWFLWLLRNPGQRHIALAGIVAVAFVMIYLWRGQRRTQPLNPSADLRAYQAAMLERYDRQIALLRRVKYWYVAPLYAWMLLVLFTSPVPPGGRAPYFLAFTGFSALVVWLNESYGVRKLRKARAEAAALFGEKD